MNPLRDVLFAFLIAAGLLTGCMTPGDLSCLEARSPAEFEWTLASGPVDHYAVEVDRGRGFEAEALTLRAGTQVVGVQGERFVVRVKAWAVNGTSGPYSPESEPVCFGWR